jgi:hypothetical protein
MAVPVTTDEMRIMLRYIYDGHTYDEALAKGDISDTDHAREVYDGPTQNVTDILASGKSVHIPAEWPDADPPDRAPRQTP